MVGTSPTKRGVSGQERLIAWLRCLLVASIVWSGIALTGRMLHLASQHSRLDLGWSPDRDWVTSSCPSRFAFLDVVYMTVSLDCSARWFPLVCCIAAR